MPPSQPHLARIVSRLKLLVLTWAGCTSVEERPRTEYLEGGIVLEPSDHDADARVPSADAGPVDAARLPPDATASVDHGVAYQSGSRLRAMTLRVEGGATRVTGWFDRTLGATCSFVPETMGGTFCLPSGTANRYFTDASCLTPVWARSRPRCPTDQPQFAHESAPTDACGVGSLIAVRRLTPSTLDPATPLFQRIGETCSAMTYLTNPELFDASEALPWSSFVTVARREKLGGVPDHETLIASDGASIPGDELDRQGTPCQFVTLDEQSYCLPSPYYFLPEGQTSIYADPICTNTALASVPSCQGKAPVAPTLLLQRAGCSQRVFRPSAPHAGFYTLAADHTCKPSMTGDPNRVDQVYTPAEPVALDTLTRAKRVLDGTGRFRVFTHRDDHDRTLFVDQIYRDTLLNANCRLSPLPGRGYYCPPESAATVYADAACTRPLLSVRASCAEPSEAFTVGLDSSQECGTMARVVRRGAANGANGPLFAKQSSGGCMPTTLGDAALYEYGADVAQEMVGVFPIVTE